MKRKKERKPCAGSSADRNGRGDEGELFLSALVETSSNGRELDLGCRILGRFTPEQKLGRGRMATVYKAHDEHLDGSIAIKVVSNDPAGQNLGLELLRREVAMQRYAQLTNCLIRLYDLYPFEQGGETMVLATMEYADGGNLRQFMSSNLSRWKHRRMHGWPLFVRTIEEYAALHDEGLLLLDAKPENVLIVNGQPKVSDIGLAVCRNGSWKGIFEVEVPPSSRGTPEYMSPEQAMARTAQTLGPQSDVYSLASMGYELLHARCERPFKLNPEYLVDGLPPYRKISGISEALNEVFARGLNADPERRQRDARALLTDLRQCDEARAALPTTPDGFMRTCSDTHLDIAPRRNCGSRTKSSRDDGRKRTVGGPSNSQTESRQVAVRREEADRICRLLLTDNPSWDLAAMGDFVRQVERLYPEHPELELARVKLDIREQRYRKEVSRGWQALQEMDVELSRRHFSRALELNTGDDRIQRVLQAVNLLLDRLIASFQGVEDGRRSGNESMMSAPSRNGYDDDLDTLAEDVIAFAGELLGMERNGHG